jgi:ketosteroid isomerase-like protein
VSIEILDRFADAQNRHDLDAFVGLFAEDYRSEQPLHPGRAFVGRDQVRENWSAIFNGVPDLRSDLVRRTASTDGDETTLWAEWHWYGTRRDGSALDMRGTTVMGVRDGLIAWGVLYMSDVQEPTETITESVRTLSGAE